jgi:dienelactone hydrolase
VVVIHGGLVTVPRAQLETIVSAPMPSRLLAAGYVIAVMTYRSRDADPQSETPVTDVLAAVEYVQKLPYVDPRSTVIYGCSGGGDLALQAAAATNLAAIASEEPASVLFTGVLNTEVPKQGERYTPADAAPLMIDPARYYTAAFQKRTRETLGRIRSPILILQGDERNLENRFNRQVLIPELKTLGKPFEVVTYPGEPHCFAFGPQAPRPEVALKAFNDVDAFFRRHVNAKATPIEPRFVTAAPVTPGAMGIPIPLPMVITALANTSTAFAGKWRTSFATSGGFAVELAVNGKDVTGSIRFAANTPIAKGQAGSVEIYDGRIDGNTISFKVKSPDGDARTITFTGTLNGDEIVFTRDVEVGPGGAPGGQGIFGALGARTFIASREK